MTLLEKMAEALWESALGISEPALAASGELAWPKVPEEQRRVSIESLKAALRAALTPTLAQVNRGGVKAFSGPQPDGGPPMIYPAAIWREMLSYVIEERDRERPDEASPEGEGEGGPEREVLREGADARPGDAADGASPASEGDQA